MAKLILISLIALHLILSTSGSIAIRKTNLLDSKKKRTNILLLWLIPFIWWFLIKQILTRNSNSDKHKQRSNFHESEKGFYGDTHH